MHEPTRELLNNDPKALDVPSAPKASLNEAGPDSPGYDLVGDFYVPPVQGLLHPPLDPDAIVARYDAYPAGH